MFRCTNCKKVDRFELMFDPAYKGNREMSKKLNDKKQVVITVDGYTFIPDLRFMNEHAVCAYCGEICCFEYFFE